MTKSSVASRSKNSFWICNNRQTHILYFLSVTGLDKKIEETLKDLDFHNLKTACHFKR